MGWPEDMWDPAARLLDELDQEDRLVQRLRERLDEALVVCPSGYAVVMAALDWREAAGVPVPVAQLRRQALRRMADLLPGRAMTIQEFDAGLAWAIAEPGLLRRDRAGAYEIVEEARTPLLMTWRSANPPHETICDVTPLEAVAVGRAVNGTPEGDPELAKQVWRKVITGDDPDAAALAEWHLADAAREGGEDAAARADLRRILEEGHFAAAPRAALALAEMELAEAARLADARSEHARMRGARSGGARPDPDARPASFAPPGPRPARADPDSIGSGSADPETEPEPDPDPDPAAAAIGRAAGFLERAVACGHPAVVVPAARLLGSLRMRQGDETGLIDACRVAFEHGDSLTMPGDGLILAALLRGVGDVDAAEQVLRRVVELDNPMYTAKAVAELAGVLCEHGDLAAAERLLTGALGREHVFCAGLQIALAGVRFANEDLPAAEELLATARTHTLPLEPDEWARAGMLSAQIAVVRGDDEAAARQFTEVLEEAADEAAAAAHLIALACGEHLRLTGPCAIPGTEPLLRHLMATAGSPLREWAAYGAGRIAHNAGDLAAAGEAYRIAAAGRDPRYGSLAALQLAELPIGPDEQDDVLDGYLRIIERDPEGPEGQRNPEDLAGERAAGVAAAVLPAGRLAHRRKRMDLVERVRAGALRHTRSAGPRAAQVAYALGVLEADVLGTVHRAIPVWEIAAGSDDPEIAAVASFSLGVARSRWLAPLTAARDLRRVVASGHPEFAPRAMLALGRLAEEFFDLDAATEAYLEALDSGHPRVRQQAAFHLACLVHEVQPDDAEAALHEIIDSAAPHALIGAAYAQLGRVYAEHGNRRLAQRYWRRGRRHPEPRVAESFADERRSIGRVPGPTRPPRQP